MNRGFKARVMHRHIGAKLEDNKAILILVVLFTITGWAIKTCRRFWRTSITIACVGYLYLSAGLSSLIEGAAGWRAALVQ